MRQFLLASTCLVSFSTTAVAETTITTKVINSVRTSTIKSGAADDIKISSAGSVVPTGGTAVLLDSANKITNEGTIQVTNADGAIGIDALAGGSGTITNASGGKIILDETYAPTDTDKDGDLDGLLAAGTGRFGIRTAAAFTGDIVNSGAITIKGNDSTGIQLGGPFTGKLTTDGSIDVVGDRSVGVHTGNVIGAVRIAGSVKAQGKDARAVAIEGDLSGALVIQGNIASTGYRSTTVPADTSKLDADDLLQGGPAISIAGNVAGGIVLAVPPTDTNPSDNDEDKDGIDDSKEGSAAVTSYGAAAALQVGAAGHDMTVGAVAGTGTGHGLIIKGSVLGDGVYGGVDGNAVVIGGLGGAVNIAGGMTVGGTVKANSSGASATALRIGTNTTVPEIDVAGSVSAAGGNAASTKGTAIAIDAGVSVGAVRNSGTIAATATGDGSAAAIVDRSGSVSLIANSGTISATGGKSNIAIDLSANTAGAEIRQTVVTQGSAPSIKGDVLLGSGNDIVTLADGSAAGKLSFGSGDNKLALSGDTTLTGDAVFGGGADTVSLEGTTVYAGNMDFGGGADTLTLSGTASFSGALANAGGLAVAVNGGRLDIGKSTTTVSSLAVGSNGTIGITTDSATKTSSLYQVTGAASFAEGSKVAIRVNGVTNAEGRYVFIRASSITGADKLTSSNAVLPFMFKSNVAIASPTELAVDITRKTTTELGLNRLQAAAYNAIYTALGKDAKVAGVFLDTLDGDRFRKQLRQMLPDHAGGTFEAVTMGSRATAGFLADPNAPFKDEGGWGWFIQQVGWGRAKRLDNTASYDISGWGMSTGAEIKTKSIGNFGVSLAYLYGKDADGGTDNSVQSKQFEIAPYWRGEWGALSTWARASWAHVDFKGKRKFTGIAGSEQVERRAKGNWNGTLVSASGGVSYDLYLGGFGLRPILATDYYRLREQGYGERGGGDAFNLFVDKRTSDEFAVSGTVALGYQFGGESLDSAWSRIEIEGGRRELVGGSLGKTTAHFAGGEEFTLVPEKRTSGWVGKIRAAGGGSGIKIAGEAGAEQQQGRAAITLRASLMIGL